MIDLSHLTKSFGDHEVLKDVSLSIPAGEIYALLGANGAGKTTIIKILSTLLHPDAGSASVDGHDVVSESLAVREVISLTGQFAAVDGILTGRENLVLIAKLRSVPDPDAVADDLLRRFDLVEAGKKPAGSYSGGMLRRLDIAMSLIGNPKVIFLDEPTTGLDPQSRLEVWATVEKLAHAGTTVLLTTQYLEEAEHLADRIGILHNGAILTEGTLADLKKLMPPTTVEYVEKQPTLEDIFLTLTGSKPTATAAAVTHDKEAL